MHSRTETKIMIRCGGQEIVVNPKKPGNDRFELEYVEGENGIVKRKVFHNCLLSEFQYSNSGKFITNEHSKNGLKLKAKFDYVETKIGEENEKD